MQTKPTPNAPSLDEERFPTLAAVIAHKAFPDVDAALRAGRHIDREDIEWYELLRDAEVYLIGLYDRYGFELVQSDGYFYLLPTDPKLGRRHLTRAEMLVGQALALLRLDPGTLRDAGKVTRHQVLERLRATVGEDRLVAALSTRRRRAMNERVIEETARDEVRKALDGLARLGFVDIDGEEVRMREPVLRFAEVVRGAKDVDQALAELMRQGRVVSESDETEDEP